MIYDITMYTDMGHLLLHPSNLPNDVSRFVFTKPSMYVNRATGKGGKGGIYYVLQEGYEKKWRYFYKEHIINVTYELDNFNSNKMEYFFTCDAGNM